ncbi:YfaP family protein [Sphingomicrobium astaxanthinifaciens]|uniref:YfaP family protein n=1 Tax=Sphingomicrobium astaxanthinifaciens TaxID=1227949 RepID=UPI00223F7D6E|nr:VIT domain-containing protein [Sphingomicrobium astaxanthinifaciens]
MTAMRFAAIMLLAGSAAVAAPNAQVERPTAGVGIEAPPLSPSLTARARGVEDERMVRDLALDDFKVTARRHGATIAVRYLMTFSAEEEGTEGRLSIDLPQGAVVTGYALDVEGQMIAGALVDQAQAREAFNTLVRGQVDPGLAEVTRDGTFNTRVFPVGREGRTIRVDFVAPVTENFALPIRLGAQSGDWTIRFDGEDGDGVFVGNRRLESGEGFASISGRGAFETEIRVAEPEQRTQVLASRHPGTGETYWQVSTPLRAPSARTDPPRVHVYWDASRSRLDDDHDAAIASVISTLEQWDPRSVQFTAFNHLRHEPQRLGDIGDVRAAVGAVRYGGASRLDWLGEAEGADRCILVSDGQATLGALDVVPDCPTLVIATRAGASQEVLGAIADRSGGALIAAGETGPALLDGLRFTSFDNVTLPHRRLPAPEGMLHAIVKAPVDARIGYTTHGQIQNFGPPRNITETDQDAILFEATRNAILEAGDDRTAFVEHARTYGIASQSLPFLVLESVEDYVRFDVTPQVDHPQFARFQRLRREADLDAAEAREDRLAQVIASWNREVAWWEKEHDPARFAERQDKDGNILPPPPPPPSPPPEIAPVPSAPASPRPPSQVDGGDGGEERLVVTAQRRPRASAESAAPLMAMEADALAVGDAAAARSPDSGIRIAIGALYPDSEWIAAYDADPAAFDATFAAWQEKVGTLPGFYLESSNWLWLAGEPDKARRVLLSALDLPLADSTTLAMVAARLEAWGEHDLAVDLRARHAAMVTHRPQPDRLLGLALAERAKARAAAGDEDGARRDYARAVALLADVALRPFDPRFNGIDMIALKEANALIPRLEALGGEHTLDPRIVKNLDSDLRVTIEWTADATDLDLHVDEPTGEHVFYGHRQSFSGGWMSNDMMQGFGPEEYWIRKAPGGSFKVSSSVFRRDRIDPNGAPWLRARLIRDFGRPTERVDYVDVAMDGQLRDRVPLGRLRIGPAEAMAAADEGGR